MIFPKYLQKVNLSPSPAFSLLKQKSRFLLWDFWHCFRSPIEPGKNTNRLNYLTKAIIINYMKIENINYNYYQYADQESSCCLSSLCNTICDLYYRAIKYLYDFFKNCGCDTFAVLVSTFLFEPWSTLKAAVQYPFGLKEDFHYYNLNPETLTSAQAEKRAIIWLHGSMDNQRSALSFASKLENEDLGPVFTENVSKSTAEEDLECIFEKMKKIQQLYQKFHREKVVIDIIGHSRGAWLATIMLLLKDKLCKENIEIGTIIRIGNPLAECEIPGVQNHLGQIFELNGNWDMVKGISSEKMPANQKTFFNCGHLGLTFDSAVHQKIIQLLNH